MSRRLLAIIFSVVLALIAALLVVRYVGQADSRAISDLSPEEVLVVTQPIPQGTSAGSLDEYVALEELPGSVVAPDALRSLNSVAGQVTVTDLYPGEQVLAARFDPPGEGLETVEIPEGYHQVTIALASTRVVGGHLAPGDTVGLFASSYDAGNETALILHKVLVTKVQGGVQVTQHDDGTETTQPAADSLLVTMAVAADDAQRIIHLAEFHGIWLSLEPIDAPEGFNPIDREDLFG